jgi:hypothetical protein
MPNEEARAINCEYLAAKFDQSAERGDAWADELRRWAAHELRLAEEHPGASEVWARAEELLGVVAYWKQRAAWAREMAGRFRRRAQEHRARLLSGL